MRMPSPLHQPAPDRVMQAAERRDIAQAARALAKRAEEAGLPLAAYLLGMAAMEADADNAWRGSSAQTGNEE